MSRSKSSSSGLVNKWSWSPALVKSIIDFVSWVPCFCFPRLSWSHDLCRSKNILFTEIVLVNCLVLAFVFCIFPLVLGIHSSNEVREALEKTIKDEFGHYRLLDGV